MSARDALRRVLRGQTLGRDEARELIVAVAQEEASADDTAVRSALFAALATRGESIDELLGAAEALRATERRFEHPFADAVDFSGTGGDAFYTFNVTAAAGLVAASAGARVILQGERALATACASADLLEAAGLSLDLEPEASAQVLEEVGITFLYTPTYHPVLAATAALRRALGVRTLLDLAAPLAHPAHVSRQVVGVGERVRAARVAAALGELSTERAFVVHGAGGADELTLAGENLVLPLGAAESASFDARALALPPSSVGALAGGDRRRNLALLERLLAGENGPICNAVVQNAAAVLVVAGLARSPGEGAELARAALRRGHARKTLARWLETSARLCEAA